MDFWGSLLGGFLDRKYATEERRIRQDELAQERERAIFNTLLNSEDPETQHLALAGLLDSANPRRKAKGFRGWIGETLESPYLAKIRALSPTVQVPEEYTQNIPSVSTSRLGSLLPSDEPDFQRWYAQHAAQQGLNPNPDDPLHFYDYRAAYRAGAAPDLSGHWPSAFKREGHPNLIVGGMDTRTGLPAGGPQQVVQPTISTPPPSPSAAMPASSPVQPGAPPPTPTGYQVEPPPTPVRLTRMAMRPRNILPTPESTAYRKAIGEARAEVEGEKARVAAGLPPRYGSSRGAGIQFGGNVRFEDLTPDEQMTVYNGHPGMILRRAYSPQGREFFEPVTTLAAGAQAPLGQIYERAARSLGLQSSTRDPQQVAQINARATELQTAARSVVSLKDAIGIAQRFLPNATIEQQMEMVDWLRSVGGGPGTAPAAAPQASPAATEPAGGATPPPTPAVAPASAQTPPEGQGGPPKLSSVVPPSLAGGSKETGKPLPPAVARTLAQAKSTNDLIDQALQALEPFKADTSLQGALDLVSQYRQGVYDPVAGAAAQLADLAGLQTSAQSQLTGGGTRAFQFYIDRRQHVPKLPSIRQVQANTILPAGAVQAISGALRDDAGTFDSPQQMYEKLQRAKANNASFIRELEQSVTISPVPSHETTPSATPKAYKDPTTGQWIIRQ